MMPLNRNLLFNHPEQIIGVLHYGLPTDDVKLRLVPYHYKGNGFRGFVHLIERHPAFETVYGETVRVASP